MTHDHQHDRDAARGMALMIVAVLIIPGMDAAAKYLSATLSPVQIGFLRYLVQSVLLLTIVTVLRRSLTTPAMLRAMGRFAFGGMCIAIASVTLFWGLQYLPLANAIAIFFVEPLILTILSAVFLGEKVGWHRSLAVAVGLVGALIVIRPNFAMFGWASVLPLIAATAFAALMATLRAMPAGLDTLRIQTVTGLFATLLLGALLLTGHLAGVELLSYTAPSAWEWSLLLAVGVVATAVQAMMTLAVRLAQASLLAPFQYLEIISATIYGYLIFDEFPDGLTWLGTAVILTAGLYVVHRERRLAKARARAGRLVPLG